MPKSVIWVVFIVSCIVAMNMATLALIKDKGTGPHNEFFQTFLSVLVLIGFIKGNRLAWQWGRYLAFIAGLGMLTAIAVPAIASGSLDFAKLPWLVFGLATFSLPFALGRPTAIQYFGLICPSCGKRTRSAADFLFMKAKCKARNKIW